VIIVKKILSGTIIGALSLSLLLILGFEYSCLAAFLKLPKLLDHFAAASIHPALPAHSARLFEGAERVPLADGALAVEVPLVGAFATGDMARVCASGVIAVGTAKQAKETHALLADGLPKRGAVDFSE
jgi:hypothetical protein